MHGAVFNYKGHIRKDKPRVNENPRFFRADKPRVLPKTLGLSVRTNVGFSFTLGLSHGKSQNALKMGRLGKKNRSKIGHNYTVRDPQTTVLSPLCPRDDAFWAMDNPKMP